VISFCKGTQMLNPQNGYKINHYRYLFTLFLSLTYSGFLLGQTYEESTYGGDEPEDQVEQGTNQKTTIRSKNTTSNLIFGSYTSMYRLHAYIGQTIRFMKPCNRHSFTTEESKTFVLPHLPFEKDELGIKLLEELNSGMIDREKYDEHKTNYEENFKITSNVAFPKVAKTEMLTINSTISERDMISTNESEITKETWEIVGIQNLPPVSGNLPESAWDNAEHLIETLDMSFMLRGTKTGRSIIWKPDEFYRCEKPDDFDGVYLTKYLSNKSKYFVPGKQYELLKDLEVELAYGNKNFLNAGSTLTYKSTKLISKRAAEGRMRQIYMHQFVYGQDSVLMPLSIRLEQGTNSELSNYDLAPATGRVRKSKPIKQSTTVVDLINIEQAEINREQERQDMLMAKYGNKFGGLIVEGRICEGMTPEMVTDAWGEADLKSVEQRGNQRYVMETFPNLFWVKYYNNKVVSFGGGN